MKMIENKYRIKIKIGLNLRIQVCIVLPLTYITTYVNHETRFS